MAHPLAIVEQQTDHPRLGRWRQAVARPVGALAEYVESFWAVESFGAYTRETILPRTASEVLFNLGPGAERLSGAGLEVFEDACLSSLHEAPFAIETSPVASLAAIRLRPEGVLPFLAIPATEVAGRVVVLRDVLGRQVDRLRQQLHAERDLGQRLTMLAAFAEARFARTPPVSAVVRGALARLGARPGMQVRELVDASGWSHRHFAARFRGEVGLPPKAFSRIARFEAAVARIPRPARLHWATLAVDAGYSDQSHMVREFQRLAGATPTAVALRLSPDRAGLLPPELA